MTAPILADPTNYGNRPGEGPLLPGGVPRPGGGALTDANLPSTKSKSAESQEYQLGIARDLSGGNAVVKSKTTAYLPQNPGEEPDNYATRLARSVFFNIFGRTIEGLVGLVFSKDPVLGKDVPQIIRGEAESDGQAKVEGHWENIDLAGTHGDVFSRDVFQDAMTAGHAAILVEFPNTGGVQSAQAEQSAIRPYWVPIKKEDIVSWRTQVVDGRLVLTQLVLRECSMVPLGEFGEKEQVRYRVFRNEYGLVSFALLEVTDDKRVATIDAGTYPTQTEIPVSEIITSGRKSLFVSDPPLIDLAFLNLAHYQQWSDYANGIHYSNVPLLTLIGAEVPQGGKMVVGPHTVLTLPIGGDAKYTSHDGSSLGSTKQSLDDLVSAMGTMGLSMLAPQKRAAETAEAKRIDEKGSDSAVGVSARGLQDGIERALGFHAKYLRQPSGGSIQINRSYDEPVMDAQTMLAFADLADKIGLPLEMVLKALQQGGRIPSTVDLVQLADEMEAAREAKKQEQEALMQDRLTNAMGNAVPPQKSPSAMDIEYDQTTGRPSRLKPAA